MIPWKKSNTCNHEHNDFLKDQAKSLSARSLIHMDLTVTFPFSVPPLYLSPFSSLLKELHGKCSSLVNDLRKQTEKRKGQDNFTCIDEQTEKQ